MASNFGRRTPKGEKADNSYFTVHDFQGRTEFEMDEIWLRRDHMIFISIDPGRVNLCFRIERRPITGKLESVEVLHHENVNFKQYERVNTIDGKKTQKQSHYVSQLYSKITAYIHNMREKINKEHSDEFVDIFDEVNMVLIERQLEDNHKSSTVAQHLISIFQTLLYKSPMRPVICDVDSKMKTNVFVTRGKSLGKTERKHWAIEKALQLSFLRKDWISFHNIIHAVGDKRDDLADTIVQLEAMCKRLDLPTTVMPLNWDEIPQYAGWQSGMIFFRHLMALIGSNDISATIGGWATILKRHHSAIIDARNNHYFDEAQQLLLYRPTITLNIRNIFSTTSDHITSTAASSSTFPQIPIDNDTFTIPEIPSNTITNFSFTDQTTHFSFT